MERVIRVTAAARNRRWIELQRVKDALEIASSDTSRDVELDRYLVAASLALSGPDGINRPPWLQSYIEDRPGDGGCRLHLSQWPILDDPPAVTHKGTAIAAAKLSVRGLERDHLFHSDGWQLTARSASGSRERALDYSITYSGGWVMPGQFTTWAATTSYAVGDWVTKSVDDEDDPLLFRCKVAGTSDATEPDWKTGYGDQVVDNDITWAAFPQRLPADLQLAAVVTAVDFFRGGLDVPSGIQSEAFRGHMVTYRVSHPGAIPPAARSLIDQYRVPVGA